MYIVGGHPHPRRAPALPAHSGLREQLISEDKAKVYPQA